MRKWVVSILLMLSVALWGQGRSGLQVGLQGGTNMRFGSSQTPRPGVEGGLDVNYSFMAPINYAAAIGFRVGVGIESKRTFMIAHIASQTDLTASSLSNGGQTAVPIHYTIAADANYEDARWTAKLPILLAVRISGFKLELGPQVSFPLQGTYTYALSNGEVDAYLVNQDVHIYNEPTLGMFPAVGTDGKGNLTSPSLALSAVAALGYEWQIGRSSRLGSRSRYAIAKTEHTLSVQLYAEYPLWQNAQMPLPAVNLWATAVPAPVVSLPELTKPVSFGVRLAYSLFPGSGKMNGCVCER